MLKKEWLEIKAIKVVNWGIWGRNCRKSETKNNKVVKAVEKMKKAEVKVLRNNEWQIENELVLKEEKIYILKDKRLRLEII